MTKQITKTAARKNNAKVERTEAKRTRFGNDAKIKILKAYDPREGTNRAKLFGLLKQSKTVGDYKARKAKAKMGAGVGVFFAKLVQNGFVRLVA
jgi:hypothetical protein